MREIFCVVTVVVPSESTIELFQDVTAFELFEILVEALRQVEEVVVEEVVPVLLAGEEQFEKRKIETRKTKRRC